MTLSERKNAAYILEHTTALPFTYCRYYYKCFFCKQQFTEIHNLLQHSISHNTPKHDEILKHLLPKGKRTVKVDISNLKCKICDKHFINIDEIRLHLKCEHLISFTDSGNGMVAYNLKLKNGQYECHICGKLFQTFILLNRHMNVHFSNAVCETCGAGFMTYQRWERDEHMADDGIRKKKRSDFHKKHHSATIYIYGP
ncbi:zinc finger protein 596-like [Hyposmocoma kahamanoa]|uniref:zinc finger protein 596-like n=1 Tax=Hyposmocoma kahamanoa TaxID=1477025 RepID=UPI000E6D66C7|nr:zinc finger protein 596-like [Hyposmocoma kahamanoa]